MHACSDGQIILCVFLYLDASRCGYYANNDGTVQDDKFAMELRLQDAVSSKAELTEQLQASKDQLEAAQQAQDAAMAQLLTVQVQYVKPNKASKVLLL